MENGQALPLTPAARRLLDHLRERDRRGQSPASLDTLCGELGLKSRGSLHRQLKQLVEAGEVQPMQGRRRGVQLKIAPPPVPVRTVPLLGRIAAGSPLEAVVDAREVTVPDDARQSPDYALTIRGDSMIEAGIHDGDTVLISKRAVARNGDIVVALVRQHEATLKRMERRGERVRLLPANPAYPVQEYPAAEVEIQGVLVGLLRWY